MKNEYRPLLLLSFIPVAFLTYLFHEFGHWVFGELTGNDMAMNLNYCWVKSGAFHTEKDALISSIGGPAFTIIQAFTALIVIEKWKTIHAYPVLYFAFFVRFFAVVFGGFMKQDEAAIALSLGIGKYTVAIIVLGVLFAMVFRGSHILKIDLKGNLIYFAVSTAAILSVIGVLSIF